jgi:hypothetical protein
MPKLQEDKRLAVFTRLCNEPRKMVCEAFLTRRV